MRWFFFLAAVGLLAGCYNLTLAPYTGGSGGQDAGTSSGNAGTGGTGGGGATSSGGISGVAGTTGGLSGGDAGVPDVPNARPDATIGGTGGGAGSDGATGTGGVVGTGGIVATGGTMGTGGTIVPELAVFAGYPSGWGSADGTGAAARFYGPSGVAVDGSGNVFVADTNNYTIRKITPSGVVTTLAGTPGMSGSANGTGAAARFYWPSGVAVDGSGNVFVADLGNSTIRKITPSGVVTTLAGTAGSRGSADGTGAAARFWLPEGVAVDGSGNVFVADTGNNTIRKITPSGVVTTLAGSADQPGSADGTGAAARFREPQGVAVDGSGNVFVADYYNGTIRKITPSGVVTTLAGTAGIFGSADGTGAAASFSYPEGVAVDGAGNVFVADSDWTGNFYLANTSNNTIRKITPAGVVTTLAGSAGLSGSADGTVAAALFNEPWGVAVDGAGNVFVADSGNNTIRKITPSGAVTTLAGTAGSSGSADGTGAAARFYGPSGVAVDGSGNVFVADSQNCTIRKIAPSGVVTTLAGTAGILGSADGTGAAARFGYPQGVAVDGSGNVFVADSGNSTIRKITPSGVVTTLAGTAGSSGSADGTGAAASFSHPRGVAVDGSGNVFVADSLDNTIRKITPSGVVTTLAGMAGDPESVAVDGSGNVFVAVAGNSTIQKITPSGVVTTLAGTAGSSGSADGTGAAALFNEPWGVAVDGSGNVFVADSGNNAIRKISTSGVVTTIVGVAAPASAGNFPGPLPASILFPDGVAFDPSTGKLYITLADAVMVAVLPN